MDVAQLLDALALRPHIEIVEALLPDMLRDLQADHAADISARSNLVGLDSRNAHVSKTARREAPPVILAPALKEDGVILAEKCATRQILRW